jgi:proteasome accessory factor A
MHSLDLEYHNLNPREGLYYALEEANQVVRYTTGEEIHASSQLPPHNTRAHGRGKVVNALIEQGARRYVLDWDLIAIGEQRQLRLKNPFEDYNREVQAFLKRD